MGRFMFITRCLVISLVVATAIHPAAQAADVYSGPQPDELLPPLEVQIGLGDDTGKLVDWVKQADGAPLVLFFLHEVTRPSVATVRTCADYATRFADQGLRVGIVFLTDNPTDARAFLQRARHAMPENVPVGISLAGIEGPGPYGLNRNVTLTVLVAKANRVTANFALKQPSLAADAPKIGAAIQSVLGHELTPSLEQMGVAPERMRGIQNRAAAGGVDDATFRSLLSPVIRRNATPEEVDSAAKIVEAKVAEDPAFATRLQSTAKRIMDAGVLENYGTPAAQEYLKKWSVNAPNHSDHSTSDESTPRNTRDRTPE